MSTFLDLMPDLQILVAQYGTYSAIPPEAWADHDRKIARAQAKLREGLQPSPKRAGKDAAP